MVRSRGGQSTANTPRSAKTTERADTRGGGVRGVHLWALEAVLRRALVAEHAANGRSRRGRAADAARDVLFGRDLGRPWVLRTFSAELFYF